MSYFGDFDPGDVVRIPFNTRDTSGAPITLSGGTLRVYKDDGTTEDDSGITLNTDFDSRTGLHLVEIDTSADGTFFSAGADYSIVLTAGTVDSISVVGVCVGSFSIQNRSAGADWVDGGRLDLILDARASQTSVDTIDGIVDDILVDTGTTLPATLSTIAGYIDTEIAALVTAVADIPTVAEFEARTLASASYATPTNITAGTITTVTNLTNAPTAGDFTATMKASIGTAVAASAVASVTGNVGGNVAGSVGSVTGAVGSVTGNVGGSVASVTGGINTGSGTITTLDALDTAQDTQHSTTQTAVATKPTLAQILAGGDVDGYTLEETLKLCLAALAGKLSGAATTTATIRAADDSKDRITATVDSDGNRTAVTLDGAG